MMCWLLAVADLEQVALVEKAHQRRSYKMVVFCWMVVDLEHQPSVKLIVVGEIRCDAYPRPLPKGLFKVSIVDEARLIG